MDHKVWWQPLWKTAPCLQPWVLLTRNLISTWWLWSLSVNTHGHMAYWMVWWGWEWCKSYLLVFIVTSSLLTCTPMGDSRVMVKTKNGAPMKVMCFFSSIPLSVEYYCLLLANYVEATSALLETGSSRSVCFIRCSKELDLEPSLQGKL